MTRSGRSWRRSSNERAAPAARSPTAASSCTAIYAIACAPCSLRRGSPSKDDAGSAAAFRLRGFGLCRLGFGPPGLDRATKLFEQLRGAVSNLLDATAERVLVEPALGLALDGANQSSELLGDA